MKGLVLRASGLSSCPDKNDKFCIQVFSPLINGQRKTVKTWEMTPCSIGSCQWENESCSLGICA